MTLKHTYAGEVLFKRYSDTSTQGQTITLALPSREELEPFIGLEGKRFQAVFVLVGDDELPAEPPEPQPAKREKVGSLCSWAAIRCTEPAFQQWVHEQSPRLDANELNAAFYVRHICGVDSRRDIDLDAVAGKAMRERIIKPYAAWLKERDLAPTGNQKGRLP